MTTTNTLTLVSTVASIASLLLATTTLASAQDVHHPNEVPNATKPTPQTMPMVPTESKMGVGMMGQMMQGGGMMDMMGSCPMMGAGAKTADALKAELGITEAQKPLWDAFAAARTKSLTGMQDMPASMMQMTGSKSPLDRIDAHIGLMERQLTSLKEIKAPLTALYGVLDAAQKQKAQASLVAIGCMM